MNKQQLQHQRKKGFTLIEVMVAVSIFALVVTIGLSSLLSINFSYTNARTKQAAMDHLNFALESMSREIRIGSQYNCGGSGGGTNDCETGDQGMSFITFDGDEMTYILNNGTIEQIVNQTDVSVLTPPEVNINDLRFRVVGSEPMPDETQPMVVISIEGTSQIRQETSSFIFQTSVSQRKPDLVSL